MSWCDKLASRPTVGVSFNKHFRPSSELLSTVVPVLDELAGPISDKFTLSKQDAFSVEFITESGFRYNIDPSRISVEFQHRIRVRNTSGGMPVMELLSKQEPYTNMLTEVSKRVLDMAELLIGSNRILERIGVVSTTIASESDAPPGIRRGIEYLSKPWKSEVESYQYQVAAQIAKTDEWNDRCIHNLVKQETDEDDRLLTLHFDYQRRFAIKKGITSLRASLATLQDVALAYFEDLAQGDMFNAHDDSATE